MFRGKSWSLWPQCNSWIFLEHLKKNIFLGTKVGTSISNVSIQVHNRQCVSKVVDAEWVFSERPPETHTPFGLYLTLLQHPVYNIEKWFCEWDVNYTALLTRVIRFPRTVPSNHWLFYQPNVQYTPT